MSCIASIGVRNSCQVQMSDIDVSPERIID
jgi:hypothetical protein